MAIAVIVCGGCGAEAAPTHRIELRGPWHWSESYGGIAGVRADPESEGYTLTYYFRRDGRLDIYKDGLLETTLDVRRVSASGSEAERIEYGEALVVFPFDLGIERHRIRLQGPDTLVFGDAEHDRFEHTFVRRP